MDHHVKQAPVQGVTGLWGGTQGSLTSGAASDPVYIENIISTVPYRFVQQGDAAIVRNVTTGLDFSSAGERKFIISRTDSTKFQVPSDWNSSNNSIECFGGGGCAGYHPSGSGGGGGGGYSRKNNVTLTAGSIVDIHIAVQVGPEGSYNGQDGQDTWFGHSSYASATVAAKGGTGGESGGTAGTGGQASAGIGDVKYSGGDGATGANNGSGGGAAGPNGDGGDATSTAGGAGDAGNGGAGGTSSNGILGQNGSNITHLFGTTGAGGGGFGRSNGNGGNGGQMGGGGGATNGNVYNVGQGMEGGIIITYTPATAGGGDGGMSWFKRRDGSENHQLYDTVRGLGKVVYSNTTADQSTNNNITSWTNDGMIVQGDSARDAANLVFWNFKITENFFDIQTWTGNGTAGRQISHNLNSTPGCIMIKCTSNSSTEWIFYHRQMPISNTNTSISNPQNSYITFSNQFTTDDSGKFNDTAPTTTNFTLGDDDDVNGSSRTYVAYIWAHNDNDTTGEEGTFGADGDNEVIHCGSFIGTGSKKAITLGWEPQWILIKNATNTGGNSGSEWFLFDCQRGAFTRADNPVYDARISPTETSAEYAGDSYVEMTPTGFNVLTDGRVNANGQRIIYMAIRRSDGYVSTPPTAGTDVFTMDTGASSSVIPNYDSGFPVDFAITRPFASSDNWHVTTRLTGREYVRTNATNAEASNSGYTFDSNVGWAKEGEDSSYLSWMWKRGKGCGVVAYEGNGSNRAINHGMNAAPEMMWVRNREIVDDWVVYHKGLNGGSSPATRYLKLNTNDGEFSDSGGVMWNSTAPTATQFTVGTNDRVNKNDDGCLAILFASVTGISKVGYYSGSNSSQTITTGFQPRYCFIKKVDSTQGWVVLDTVRGWASGDDQRLEFHNNSAQNDSIDFGAPTSTGFTLLGNVEKSNQSGGRYIYYAHA